VIQVFALGDSVPSPRLLGHRDAAVIRARHARPSTDRARGGQPER